MKIKCHWMQVYVLHMQTLYISQIDILMAAEVRKKAL